MKISSQNSMKDIPSVGVNVSEQGKGAAPVQDFKSYMNQSASAKSSGVEAGAYKSPSQKTEAADTSPKTEKAEKPEQAEKPEDKKAVDAAAQSDKKDEVKAEPAKDGTEGCDTAGEDVNVSDEVKTQVKGLLPEQQDENVVYDNAFLAQLASLLQNQMSVNIAPEQLEQLLQDVRVQVEGLLGMDDGQFDNLLSQLDMQCVDLLDSEGQKQFLLAAKDAQPVDLLTDEELSQLLTDMETVVTQTVEEAEIKAPILQEAITRLKPEENQEQQPIKASRQAVTPESNMPELSEGQNESSMRFTVETDSRTGQEHQGASLHRQDIGAMKEQVLAQLNQGIEQLSEVEQGAEPVAPAEIVRQVVEEIKLIARQDTTSMELQLYPEHLGKVTIQVSTRNGAVTAQITAQNEMAKAALEGSIQTLKETFQNQEIKVDAIEVMVATSSFSGQQFENQQMNQENGRAGKGVRHINLDELESEDELSEEEQLNVEMMRQEGRNVDYTA